VHPVDSFDSEGWFSYDRLIFTGSIERSARRRYLIYSEADFEVLRPAGTTRCTDGGKFGKRQISPPSVLLLGYGTSKLKFLLRFDQNVEYKRHADAYPLRDFHEICRVCTQFQDALDVKISLDSLNGLRSYGGFKFTWSGYPQIFSAS